MIPALKIPIFQSYVIFIKYLSENTDDLDTKEMMLTENVLNRLPTLFDKLFIHINNNNADTRYQLIQQYAKQQNQLKWECKAANTYYKINF